jgi:hypothetical protein
LKLDSQTLQQKITASSSNGSQLFNMCYYAFRLHYKKYKSHCNNKKIHTQKDLYEVSMETATPPKILDAQTMVEVSKTPMN